MNTWKRLMKRLSILLWQRKKIENLGLRIGRMQGESFNVSLELLSLKVILTMENGNRFFAITKENALLVIAVADRLPEALQSRIYLPSFGSDPIGNLRLRKDGENSAYILEELFVSEKFRRLGIGTALLGETLRSMGAAQGLTVGGELLIGDDSTRSAIRKFLEGAGFDVSGAEATLYYHYRPVKAK